MKSHDIRAAFSTRLFQSARYFNGWTVCGPSNAQLRADLMTILEGKRVPKSRAGYFALEKAALEAFGIRGTCPNDSEKQLNAAMRELVTVSA